MMLLKRLSDDDELGGLGGERISGVGFLCESAKVGGPARAGKKFDVKKSGRAGFAVSSLSDSDEFEEVEHSKERILFDAWVACNSTLAYDPHGIDGCCQPLSRVVCTPKVFDRLLSRLAFIIPWA